MGLFGNQVEHRSCSSSHIPPPIKFTHLCLLQAVDWRAVGGLDKAQLLNDVRSAVIDGVVLIKLVIVEPGRSCDGSGVHMGCRTGNLKTVACETVGE